MSDERVRAALISILGLEIPVDIMPAPELAGQVGMTRLDVAGTPVAVAWLPVGWPRQVREVLARSFVPDLVAAPEMSPGARLAAAQAGLGWFDETGAADLVLGPTFRIRQPGTPLRQLDANLGWRPATTAVCEVLLTGTAATVSAVHKRTGLALSTVATALKFLETQKLLHAEARRGPGAARSVTETPALLEAYTAAAIRLRSPLSIRVGTLWRDPITGVTELGKAWTSAGVRWATTGALTAEILAPLLTQLSPMEIYLDARTLAALRVAALRAGLTEAAGGRLLLRPFPSPIGPALSKELRPGFWSVPWPRAFADLRATGVRGEEAADHLREVCEGD